MGAHAGGRLVSSRAPPRTPNRGRRRSGLFCSAGGGESRTKAVSLPRQAPPGVIVTDADDACADTPDPNDEADDKWPPDFDDNQVINILDLNRVMPPFFGHVCT